MIAAALQNAAWAQIEAARANRPLAYRDAEPHPAEMVAAPTNNLGALYRVAYWSAVAARIALSQGTDPRQLFALATSSKTSAVAAVSLGSGSLGLFSAIGAVYSPGGTDAIDKILLRLERLAATHGVEEVASTMWLQRKGSAQLATRETSAPMFQLSIPLLGTGLDQINRSLRIGLAITVTLIGFGAILWVARPVLAPAARIAGTAAADAWERRRAKRRGRRGAR